MLFDIKKRMNLSDVCRTAGVFEIRDYRVIENGNKIMNTSATKTNGKASPEVFRGNEANGTELSPAAQAEQDMLYKLKSGIDQNGSYKYRLNDLSTGFGAGRGINVVDARTEIIEKFEKQFGKDPYKYMNDLFEKRQEMTQSNGRSSGRGR